MKPLSLVNRRPPPWFVLLACAAILAARRPDLLHTPQFWAEDGNFYQEAFTLGWRGFVTQYAGYLHTIPRLVSALAALADPRWAPAIFVSSAALFTLGVAARAMSARCPLPLPAVCALAVVLLPDAGEVLLNIVNLQWVLAGGFLLLLISADAQSNAQRAHDVVAAIALGLTGPFSVVLTPLFVCRAWRRRTRESVILGAIVAACGIAQAWLIVTHPVPPPPGTPTDVAYSMLLPVVGMRLLGSLFIGKFLPGDFSLPVETALGIAALLAIVLLGVSPGPRRAERGWLALALLGLLASSLYRCRHVLPDLRHAGYGARYFFPLQLGLFWLFVAKIDGPKWARAVAIVTIWIFAVNIGRLCEGGFEDLHWAAYADKIRAGEPVRVMINPAGWSFEMPARKR